MYIYMYIYIYIYMKIIIIIISKNKSKILTNKMWAKSEHLLPVARAIRHRVLRSRRWGEQVSDRLIHKSEGQLTSSIGGLQVVQADGGGKSRHQPREVRM